MNGPPAKRALFSIRSHDKIQRKVSPGITIRKSALMTLPGDLSNQMRTMLQQHQSAAWSESYQFSARAAKVIYCKLALRVRAGLAPDFHCGSHECRRRMQVAHGHM